MTNHKRTYCSKGILATALLMLATTAGNACAADAKSTGEEVQQLLDQSYPRLEALYKDLHQHPELGFQETRSAAILAKQMRALGFEVTEGVGKTGLVAIYRNGPGPTVLVRTELDALPLAEKTGLPYASQATATWNGKQVPVMHACGHDIHMATWVGTASVLVNLKNQWNGTLMFIGQPSEENIRGAKAMVDDGLFKRFQKPDYGFALHVTPFPYGQVFYKPGPVTSSADSIELTFHGKGGHGSMPAATIDPILIASRFVDDVQSLVSRETDPMKFSVVTIGAFQAGSAGNIIPDQALLRGTVRTFDPDVRKHLLSGIRRIAQAEAQMASAPEPEIRMDFESTGPVINDAALTTRTVEALKPLFGENLVLQPQAGSGSEDYSVFIEAGVPSLFLAVGGLDPDMIAKARKEGQAVPVNHSPLFAPVPEPTIRTGVKAMALAVMNVLPPQP